MNNLQCGGAEKALVNLLQEFDYSKYEVDLLLFKQEGMFLPLVPKEVNLLNFKSKLRLFDGPISLTIKDFFKSFNLQLLILRILAGFVYKKNIPAAQKEQRVWKYIKHILPKQTKQYDVAIGFLEKTPNYYCIDKVNADIKIGFVNNDYNMLQMDPNIDLYYFEKFNFIATVSEQCAKILSEIFPNQATKVKIIENIVTKKTISELAEEKIEIDKDKITFVSVGRLFPQKGYDIAIQVANELKNKGLKFKWYILGEGVERQSLEKEIKKYELEDFFILKGLIENPYPYIKAADIFIMTSRFEGKSLAITEAMLLNKVILVTDFETAKDQIVNNRNGIITSFEISQIVNSIIELLKNESLQRELKNNLILDSKDNSDEVEKLYSIINQ